MIHSFCVKIILRTCFRKYFSEHSFEKKNGSLFKVNFEPQKFLIFMMKKFNGMTKRVQIFISL
jgi:hypothetical protein